MNACRYYGALILGALHGHSKAELLSAPDEWEFLETDAKEMLTKLDPAILEVVNGSFKHRQPPYIQGSGYVGPQAWKQHCGHFTSPLHSRQAALMAANLGDDADTTSAIYGQLAGAYYGEQGIPLEWRKLLALVDVIMVYADKLYELAR